MSKEEQLKKGFSTKYEWINDMKIAKTQLKQIIKEELGRALNEDEDSDRRVIQLVKRAVDSFTEIFSPEELSLIADRDNRDMFVHYLFENIQLQMDKLMPQYYDEYDASHSTPYDTEEEFRVAHGED
jgi:hypothetical protein